MRLLLPLLLAVALHSVQDAGAQTSRPKSSNTSVGWFGLSLECRGCVDSLSGRSAGDHPAIITGVLSGGGADKASLKVGDTIFAVNGKAVKARELRAALAAANPNATLILAMGTRRGRFTYHLTKQRDSLAAIGRESLPIRYHGEFAAVTIDVLTKDTPVVSRDSTGAMLIQVGGHVVRLRESRPDR